MISAHKSTFLLAMLASVVLLMASSKPLVAEPEVVCAWCVEVSDALGNTQHGFPNPSDRCEGSAPQWGSDSYCARCGGTSSCHGFNGGGSEGTCHIACGGDNLAFIQDKIAESLENGDAQAIAAVVTAIHDGATVSYSAKGGRIEITADCNPTQVAARFVVPGQIRDALRKLKAGDDKASA